MALRGTLKDFGIADVFQLIGLQAKTGALVVAKGAEKVVIHFDHGNVVRSESTTRQKQDLLGNMLRRAEAITEPELNAALEVQKVTRRRLGDILIESGAITEAELASFTRLQTTETVHRLFLWNDGTYEFEHSDQSPAASHPPLRTEALLMEGFRQVDEWPAIRRKISSYAMTFKNVTDLEALLSAKLEQSSDLNLDAAFDDFGNADLSSADARLKFIEERERLVYGLIQPGRDVQKLIDLSRLGEFETCKALATLMDTGFVEPVLTDAPHAPSGEAVVGGITAPRPGSRLTSGAMAGIGVAVVLAIGWCALYIKGIVGLSWASSHNAAEYLDMSLQAELGRAQILDVRRALAVYQAEHGSYPDRLDALVEARLLPSRALGFPWEGPYYYARTERSYTLLRPLY